MRGPAAPKDPEKARPYFYIIKEKDIRPEELSSYSFVRLFNAMIKWGALEFSTGTIYG